MDIPGSGPPQDFDLGALLADIDDPAQGAIDPAMRGVIPGKEHLCPDGQIQLHGGRQTFSSRWQVSFGSAQIALWRVREGAKLITVPLLGVVDSCGQSHPAFEGCGVHAVGETQLATTIDGFDRLGSTWPAIPNRFEKGQIFGVLLSMDCLEFDMLHDGVTQTGSIEKPFAGIMGIEKRSFGLAYHRRELKEIAHADPVPGWVGRGP